MAYVRWKHGLLTPLERAIIRILAEHTSETFVGLHGYELAKILAGNSDLGRPKGAAALHATGAVYKSLRSLSRVQVVTSSWEDPETALEAGRPRRRYYMLTKHGLGRAQKMPMWEKVHAWIMEAMATTGS